MTIEEIENEKRIREDQKYKDCVEQLQKDVKQILAMMESLTSVNKNRNRVVVSTVITAFLVIFANIFVWVSSSNNNVASHQRLQKEKAEREALNHSAEWLKALDERTKLGYSNSYYDMVKVPPERDRGVKSIEK